MIVIASTERLHLDVPNQFYKVPLIAKRKASSCTRHLVLNSVVAVVEVMVMVVGVETTIEMEALSLIDINMVETVRDHTDGNAYAFHRAHELRYMKSKASFLLGLFVPRGDKEFKAKDISDWKQYVYLVRNCCHGVVSSTGSI
ncbi:hypothetical protein MKW98_024237 [Papaver atlanticum]|uniref:Uncharacterized protein n=1 Tax=Papaver atlanticum TaxID=357466 RepID=A0AAD4T0P0_9MAGN|nr:hypothetical protein MKW98_024237 [Papaver atlanticum]